MMLTLCCRKSSCLPFYLQLGVDLIHLVQERRYICQPQHLHSKLRLLTIHVKSWPCLLLLDEELLHTESQVLLEHQNYHCLSLSCLHEQSSPFHSISWRKACSQTFCLINFPQPCRLSLGTCHYDAFSCCICLRLNHCQQSTHSLSLGTKFWG